MDENWHINADQLLQKELVPTTLTAGDVDLTLEFPPPEQQVLKFQAQPLALYQQSVDIVGRVSDVSWARPFQLTLRTQACDDTHCLQPEQKTLFVRARPR